MSGEESIIESMGGGVQKSPEKPEQPEDIHKRSADIHRGKPEGRRNEATNKKVANRLLRQH